MNEDSELLVIDIAAVDPYIQALEQACNISFNETLFQHPEFISLPPEILPQVDFAAAQLLDTQEQTNPQVNCQLISLFLTQICQIHSPESTRPIMNTRLDAARLNEIIERHLSEPPGNAELASALHLSESHFYCLCQRQFGMPPQQYVMNRRMRRAHFLLTNSAMPLAVLAAELGFSDASSFSRAYKKHYQQTPGSTRRLVRSQSISRPVDCLASSRLTALALGKRPDSPQLFNSINHGPGI